MCGEQLARTRRILRKIGSPPRVRGTASEYCMVTPGVRITPACAGNSSQQSKQPQISMDHPRVCGEQLFRTAKTPCLPGSPPRVRGTVSMAVFPSSEGGITPACAGNSAFYRFSGDFRQDHPRVCGEQLKRRTTIPGEGGSPPRVRGTGVRRVGKVDVRRITPACAGNRIFIFSITPFY